MKTSPSAPPRALAVAFAAAVLAGILVFVALGSRSGTADGVAPAPVSVIVADRLIPKGSSGEAIAAGRIARPADIRAAAVSEGALTSISEIRGQVAKADIYPGEQLTASAFKPADATNLTTKLTGSVRGISIPLDAAHGLVGQAEPGDHVDVYASLTLKGANGDPVPVLKQIATNIEVLRTPPGADGEGAAADMSVVTLRMVGKQAAQLAFASDNGKVWMVLRPPTGAVENRVPPVTIESLMSSGSRPVVGTAASRGAKPAPSPGTPAGPG